MRAGQLRHRVTIQAPIATRNSYGEEEISHVDVATVWARVEPVSAREFSDQQRDASAAVYTITMRYRRDVGLTMRLVWSAPDALHVMEINSIVPDAARRELTITATEVPVAVNAPDETNDPNYVWQFLLEN